MRRLLILGLAVFAPSLRAATCQPPAPCQPGDKVSVVLLDRAKYAGVTKILLSPANGAAPIAAYPVLETLDQQSISFVIPAKIPDGSYQIQVRATPKPDQAAAKAATADQAAKSIPVDEILPGQLVVESPTITAVSPNSAFLTNGVHNFAVLGRGFRKDLTSVRFPVGTTPERCAPNSQPTDRKQCYWLSFKDEHEIGLAFYTLDRAAGYYHGKQTFRVVVDGVETNDSQLSLVDTTENMPRNIALAGLAIIVLVILGLVLAGKKVIKQTFGNKDYVLSAFFLDPRTSSYSLSKCQFYAWTAAAVLGYLFLAVSKSYVQGSAAFPDIPSGLPGILIASVGTLVVANGIASTKGDKGAGSPQPNLSDFITSGGVVAADRVQFAVWTIVGISTFLAIVWQSDPRDINDLPTIPSGFLQLMGISAGGYLAGKLARKAGPTLDAIAISGTPDKFTLQLTGSALSRSALFTIDDAPIYPDSVQGANASSKLPSIVQLDPTVNDPDFARILSFAVTQPQASWIGGATPHSFTIINPDKQKATLPFQIFKVNAIKITASSNLLEITGEFLDEKLKVSYTKTGGQATDVTNPQSASSQNFKATVEASLTGQVTVTVADTSGFSVTRSIAVT